MDPVGLTEKIDQTIDNHRQALVRLSRAIHAHPELKFEEHKACEWLLEYVESLGAHVERNLGDLKTSFRATVGSGGPTLAILSEYDALPDIGHACGHNLIATAGLGAFVGAASVVQQTGGTLQLIGTPAEEGGGGKIILLDAGVFDNVEAAMMVHPADRDVLLHPTLANLWVTFVFKGKASHAALAPWDGASALTACIQTFTLIDSQRVHFRDGVRVHGWIPEGGHAVNIIPNRAACEFSVRATTTDELERVLAVVIRCAKGAAIACGVDVEVEARRGYKEMWNNEPMALRFGKQLDRLGRTPKVVDDTFGSGSTDMGDVSQRVPSIHPWIAICAEGRATCHQHDFAHFAASENGMDSMIVAAKAMANVAAEFLQSSELRQQTRQHFENKRAKKATES